MSSELLLHLFVSIHGHLCLAMIIRKLHLKLSVEARAGHAGPFLLVLGSEGGVLLLLIIQKFLHLPNHLNVVLSDCRDTGNHSLQVAMASLLLEIFDFLPKCQRNFGS